MSKINGTVIAASRLESGEQATCGIVVWTTEKQKDEIWRCEDKGRVVVERKSDHDAREAEVKRLREELARHLEGEAMKDKVLKWLLNGQVGLSSRAMAAHLCGFPCRGDYPRDPDDLNRCVMLLDAVPEARTLLPKMAEVNRYWAALVSRWDEIETAYREEQLRPRGFYSAPKTYKIMNEIINKADKAEKARTA